MRALRGTEVSMRSGSPRPVISAQPHATEVSLPSPNQRHQLAYPGSRLDGGVGENCRNAAVDVSYSGDPATHADLHGGAAIPGRRPTPAGSLLLDRADDGLGKGAEIHQNLVERDIVQLGVSAGADSVSEPPGQPAGPVHQPGHAGPAKRREHGP